MTSPVANSDGLQDGDVSTQPAMVTASASDGNIVSRTFAAVVAVNLASLAAHMATASLYDLAEPLLANPAAPSSGGA